MGGGSGTSPSRSARAVEMRHLLRARASTALSQAVSPRDSALSCSLPPHHLYALISVQFVYFVPEFTSQKPLKYFRTYV